MAFAQRLKGVLVAAFAVAIPLTLVVPGCGSDDSSSPGGGGSGDVGGSGTGGPGTGGTGAQPGVCLLNNCHSDQECATCSFSRTKCKVSENRCVACDPANPGASGCPAGQECTSFGTCAPAGQTCPADAQGRAHHHLRGQRGLRGLRPDPPDLRHHEKEVRVMHGHEHELVRAVGHLHRQQVPAQVPRPCVDNNDCQRCDYTDGQNIGKKAHACFNHKCSECNDTYACPSGLQCTKGQCVKPCGLQGQTAGTCNTDTDCGGCGDGRPGRAAWKCKFPINGALHGTCAVRRPAARISAIGRCCLRPTTRSRTRAPRTPTAPASASTTTSVS